MGNSNHAALWDTRQSPVATSRSLKVIHAKVRRASRDALRPIGRRVQHGRAFRLNSQAGSNVAWIGVVTDKEVEQPLSQLLHVMTLHADPRVKSQQLCGVCHEFASV